MSALNYILMHDKIYLAMDTLAVSPVDKCPVKFLTKFSILPHLNLVMAGTGETRIICDWFQFVNWNLNIRDINELNECTPTILQEEWLKRTEPSATSSTIYHFGYSDKDEVHVGYAYRSRDNWVSERLEYSIGIKPKVELQQGSNELEVLINTVREQSRMDRELPVENKVGIGGDVCVLIVNKKNITASSLYRLETYGHDYRMMPSTPWVGTKDLFEEG